MGPHWWLVNLDQVKASYGTKQPSISRANVDKVLCCHVISRRQGVHYLNVASPALTRGTPVVTPGYLGAMFLCYTWRSPHWNGKVLTFVYHLTSISYVILILQLLSDITIAILFSHITPNCMPVSRLYSVREAKHWFDPIRAPGCCFPLDIRVTYNTQFLFSCGHNMHHANRCFSCAL